MDYQVTWTGKIEIDYSEDNVVIDSYIEDFKIIIKMDTFSYKVSVEDVEHVRWTDLINAIVLNRDYCYDAGTTNGECTIEIKEDIVHFTIAKSGDGRGGCSKFSFPAINCLQTFTEINDLVKELNA